MRRLIIECGVAQTRAALLIDDVVWKFWFGPARGDEAADIFPRTGRRFAGRVKTIDRSLNAAFVDLGDGRDAFLPLKKSYAASCIEGALIEIEIKSPPRQSKGAALRFVQSLEKGAPGRLPPFKDPVLDAVEIIGAGAKEISVDDGGAAQALQAAGFNNIIHENKPLCLFEKAGVGQDFDLAFLRQVPLIGGGRLVIDEAQALTAIDVDTGGLSASSPARLREKIAFAAAEESMRQISLRNIGGHIVIDFPDIPGDAGRKRFQDHMRKMTARLPGASAASFSRSGLYSFTAPHHALSLLDRFTQEDATEPVAGRRFTVETIAKMAIALLERRLRSAPAMRFKLAAGASIVNYIDTNDSWRARLTDRYGARFDIIADDKGGDRNFDLAEQR